MLMHSSHCTEMATSKQMFLSPGSVTTAFSTVVTFRVEGSGRGTQALGLGPSQWPAGIASPWNLAILFSEAKSAQWRPSQPLSLSLRGGTELARTLSLRWVEPAEHFPGRHGSHGSGAVCRGVCPSPGGLAKLRKMGRPGSPGPFLG